MLKNKHKKYLGVKNNVQDLSLMPRNIKNEGEDLEL